MAIQRSRRFALGVSGNFLAKLSGAGVQILAIPVAIKLLGVHDYVAFATLNAVAAWPALFLINFGPRLFARIAASDEATLRTKIFQGCMKSVVLNTALVLFSMIFFLCLYPVEFMFPKLSPLGFGRASVMAFSLTLLNVLSGLFTIPEAFQIGLQKLHLISAATFTGNFVSLILILFLLPHFPSIEVFAYSLTLPMFFARLVNGAFFFGEHRYLLDDFIKGMARANMVDSHFREGIAFTLVTGVASYLCNQLPLLLLARFGSSTQAATYASLLTVLGMAMQPVVMLIAPIIPAVSSSLASGDVAWVRKALRRLTIVVVSYGGFVLVSLPFLGPFVYSQWSISLQASPWLMFFVGTYIFSICAESCLFWLCHVAGGLRNCYLLYMVRTLATVLAALALCFDLSLEAYFAIVTFATMGTMVIPLYNISRKHLLEQSHANSRLQS